MNDKMSVSIIVPAFKEEEFIEETLKNYLQVFSEVEIEFEIIVIIDKVYDDKTDEIVKKIAENAKEVSFVIREGKRGVGSAIKEGIKRAQKNNILIATAEISEDPHDLLKMVKKMNDGFDMVFGNRFYTNAKREGYSKKQYYANRLCNYTIKILFRINSNDVTNGVKVYKSSILKNLKLTGTSFDIFAEIPIKSYQNGNHNFIEIPLKHYARERIYSKFNFKRESKLFFLMVLKCFFNK
jgi:dolichol-phosphate mannosyltransferase|tara:strand:+ start:1033 stop:1749 length:717 start_codon:yes stop_codon:yes gene_type:complete